MYTGRHICASRQLPVVRRTIGNLTYRPCYKKQHGGGSARSALSRITVLSARSKVCIKANVFDQGLIPNRDIYIYIYI